MMGYYSALVVPVCDMKMATNCFNGQKLGYQASCGTIFQFQSRRQTPSSHLRVGLKPSFLIKLIVRAVSGSPWTSP